MDKINDIHFRSSLFTFQKAVELIKRMTDAETVLRETIRNKKLHGLKFRRQHPIDRFIDDFYCHQYKLVIELDGNIHELSEVKDNNLSRKDELINLNLNMLRFKNEEVLLNLPKVLEVILEFIDGFGKNPPHQNHPLGLMFVE
jgi:very-short-patch-repair endonuclease